MSWKEEVEGIELRRRAAAELGGAENVEKQHVAGRLTVRERIDALLDAGSFREQGPIAGHSQRDAEGKLQGFAPANYVLGFGKIDGRPVVVGGEDFTLRGGSPSPAGNRKSVFLEDLACQYQLPMIRLLEGGGGSVAPPAQGQAAAPSPGPETSPRFMSIMRAMAQAPVVSAALGAVAGMPAARLVASHLTLMTQTTSQVLVGGPALVERALRVKLTKEQLGGPDVHLKSGVVDNVAADEREVFREIRRFLSYLPTNVGQRAPRGPTDDPPGRREEELLSIVPRERRRAYKMRRILSLVLDRDSLFEIAPLYGRTQITALARLHGQPVGVIANDPYFYAGSMTADGAQKVRRFIDSCDSFGLPIISFVDEPGFMIGPDAEQAATIRHGVALMFAVMQSSVPWISVIVRKVYGVAGGAHFGPGGMRIAWPSAESGALPIEGGVAVAFRREIESAPDPEARRRELEERLLSARSAYAAAEAFGVHDMIDPRGTRGLLCDWLEMIEPRLSAPRGVRTYSYRP
ncbi:MAG TPA: carboxyl transferase domain-containing protein [Polyangiales bacterium]|nr:carboxyl transferase domain-containing protein [Polyangiales bacterium]